MDSINEHNSALQKNGNFTIADLEANQQGKFSSIQIKRFEDERNFIKETSGKYNNKGWLISLIFGVGNSLKEEPIGNIQTIEARAEAYQSQGGINRRGHQSAKISYILQMDSIKFIISESLMNTIQNKRLYRVYAVKDGGVWVLLSMEAIE